MENKKKVASRRLSQGGNKEGEPKERQKQKRKIGRGIKGNIMKEKKRGRGRENEIRSIREKKEERKNLEKGVSGAEE